MTDTAPWFYSVFNGQTRDKIEGVLGHALKMRADRMVDAMVGMAVR